MVTIHPNILDNYPARHRSFRGKLPPPAAHSSSGNKSDEDSYHHDLYHHDLYHHDLYHIYDDYDEHDGNEFDIDDDFEAHEKPLLISSTTTTTISHSDIDDCEDSKLVPNTLITSTGPQTVKRSRLDKFFACWRSGRAAPHQRLASERQRDKGKKKRDGCGLRINLKDEGCKNKTSPRLRIRLRFTHGDAPKNRRKSVADQIQPSRKVAPRTRRRSKNHEEPKKGKTGMMKSVGTRVKEGKEQVQKSATGVQGKWVRFKAKKSG